MKPIRKTTLFRILNYITPYLYTKKQLMKIRMSKVAKNLIYLLLFLGSLGESNAQLESTASLKFEVGKKDYDAHIYRFGKDGIIYSHRNDLGREGRQWTYKFYDKDLKLVSEKTEIVESKYWEETSVQTETTHHRFLMAGLKKFTILSANAKDQSLKKVSYKLDFPIIKIRRASVVGDYLILTVRSKGYKFYFCIIDLNTGFPRFKEIERKDNMKASVANGISYQELKKAYEIISYAGKQYLVRFDSLAKRQEEIHFSSPIDKPILINSININNLGSDYLFSGSYEDIKSLENGFFLSLVKDQKIIFSKYQVSKTYPKINDLTMNLNPEIYYNTDIKPFIDRRYTDIHTVIERGSNYILIGEIWTPIKYNYAGNPGVKNRSGTMIQQSGELTTKGLILVISKEGEILQEKYFDMLAFEKVVSRQNKIKVEVQNEQIMLSYGHNGAIHHKTVDMQGNIIAENSSAPQNYLDTDKYVRLLFEHAHEDYYYMIGKTKALEKTEIFEIHKIRDKK
jgi:hypothetical protein